MRTLRELIGAICAILFIISAVLVLLLINVEAKAFSSATYKQAFADQRLYERMPAILATALTSTMGQNINAVPFLRALAPEDWQNTIAMLLPPEELTATANNALDATFDYLNGRSSSAALSLIPLKTQLAGPSGMNVVLQILSIQPACTAEQLTQMALGLLGGEIALCNPPPEAVNLMTPFLQSQLQTMTTILPNEVTFIPGTLSGTPQDPRLQLNRVRSLIKWTPLLPLLLLFALTIFAVRSLRDWLAWWGWPFMIAGVSSVLIGLVGAPLVGWILQLLIQGQGTLPIPPALTSSITETTSAVARQILIPVMIQGALLGMLGLGMAILGMFLPRKQADPYVPY
ncbi:MAG TPA: hypothetical protein VJ830_05085 [Anaerolineales bacterium]|nr:hypothetical protein [Anaerolineales bacterium]